MLWQNVYDLEKIRHCLVELASAAAKRSQTHPLGTPPSSISALWSKTRPGSPKKKASPSSSTMCASSFPKSACVVEHQTARAQSQQGHTTVVAPLHGCRCIGARRHRGLSCGLERPGSRCVELLGMVASVLLGYHRSVPRIETHVA